MFEKIKSVCNVKKFKDSLDNFKLAKLIKKEEEPVIIEKKTNPFVVVLAVIGAIASVAAIAYAVYRFVCPEYIEDFDDLDDFDDLEDDEV